MDLKPGNAQWIGTREDQQDAFGFTGFDSPYFQQHAGVLAVLADGMGGMSNGREASRRAVLGMLEAYREKRPDESVPDALRRALTAANRAVYALACASGGEGSAGTTLVAAAVRGGQLFWVGAGDSRLYLYRAADGSLTQCTRDHTYGNELRLQIASGELSAEALEEDPDRNALTSFLGLAEVPEVDASLRPLPLAAGDRLLLCSDGIHGALSEPEITRALADEAQAAADALIAAVQAQAIDHQDNATAAVLVCQADSVPEAPGGAGARRGWSRILALSALAIAIGLGLWLAAGPPPRPIGGGQESDAGVAVGVAPPVSPVWQEGTRVLAGGGDAPDGAAGSATPIEAESAPRGEAATEAASPGEAPSAPATGRPIAGALDEPSA